MCACVWTHSDGQFSGAGAQGFVDGAVEHLLVVEGDVTEVRANRHGVFLQRQVQLARPFLTHQHTNTCYAS